MKSLSVHLCLVACIATWVVGCGPKPVADDTSRPAAEVTVDTETTNNTTPETEATPEASGVDVQVGGGQGVQVEVDREPDFGN